MPGPINIPFQAPEEQPRPEPTPEEWRERAERFRRAAARWRDLVEREEASGIYGRVDWSGTKAMMLELAQACDRDAEQAETRANQP